MKASTTIAVLGASISFASAGQLWEDVCTQSDTKGLPFCDTTATLEDRVADYVKRVPLSSKAAMMTNSARGCEFLKCYLPPLPSLTSLTSTRRRRPPHPPLPVGLRGPPRPAAAVRVHPGQLDVQVSDQLPVPVRSRWVPDGEYIVARDQQSTLTHCPLASSGTAFNNSLYFLIGQADGREARAINNLRNHVTQNVYGDGIDCEFSREARSKPKPTPNKLTQLDRLVADDQHAARSPMGAKPRGSGRGSRAHCELRRKFRPRAPGHRRRRRRRTRS